MKSQSLKKKCSSAVGADWSFDMNRHLVKPVILYCNAVISACTSYRYQLERAFKTSARPADRRYIAFFGINPSTADASREDATTRKWAYFTAREGFDGYLAGNVFAFRSKDVSDLKHVDNPVGRHNDTHIDAMISRAEILVPCWGDQAKVPKDLRPHIDALMEKLLASGKPVMTLGLTAAGHPKHPLYLSNNTPLQPYERAA